MEIDFKSIMLAIIIIGVVVVTIYLGAQILNTDNSNNTILENTTENITTHNTVLRENNIKKTETNTNENTTETVEIPEPVENTELPEETIIETSTEISIEEKTEKYGTGLEINNNFPIISFDEKYRMVSEGHRHQGIPKVFNYRVPFSWDMDGNNADFGNGYFHIDVNTNPTSNYGDYIYGEVTYEQFLNDYIQKDKEKDHFSKYSEYTFRELNTGGTNTLTIIEKTNSYTESVHNILVFVSGLYEYHIDICVENKDYETFLPIINNILSSSYISM